MAETAVAATESDVMMAAVPSASMSKALQKRMERERRSAPYDQARERWLLAGLPVDLAVHVPLFEQ